MTLQGYIVGTKGNTGRGIASIVENADYTITINLTDGTSYTTAPIAGFTAVDFDENYDLVVTKTDGTTETVETDIEDFRTLLEGYKDSAETAETNAETAQTAAETAQGLAETAQGKAEDAQTAAETAQGKAEDAQSAAETAQSAAETAQGKAETAQGKAEDAQTAAETAQTGAETAETNASTYATNASGSASTASTKAGEASTSATTASTKASEAAASALASEGYANGKQNGTDVTSGSPYYENNAKYFAEQAEDSAEAAAQSAASLTVDDELDGTSANPVQNKVIKGALDTKAEIDGYYESLGSGTADQLASNIYEEDNVPYNFRTSGGSIDIGDRETDMLVGGTVAWNQLVQPSYIRETRTISGITFTNNANGTVTINGTLNESQTGAWQLVKSNVAFVENHVYAYLTSQDTFVSYCNINGTPYNKSNSVFKATASATRDCYLLIPNGVQYTNVVVKPQVFDLTAMFGSTIADYIYTLEQGQAGAGVAWFKKLFPKPYYAYNAGELMSVQASSHDMVGFNQCSGITSDKWLADTNGTVASVAGYSLTDYIRVLPNTQYYNTKTESVRTLCYDADKNLINTGSWAGILTNGGIFTTPSDAHYVRITIKREWVDNFNFNLSWDGERDGEYEAYVKHSYPLDSSLTLRGIPKLDASNNLYYDGDTYESDGTVTRKYGIVDLGSLNWKIVSGTAGGSTTGEFGYFESLAQITNAKAPSANNQTYRDGVCSNFLTGVTASSIFFGTDGGGHITVAADNKLRVSRTDNTKDASQFKTAMNGVYLVYELATPTTETADPYTNPQIVNDFGTEEYVDYAVSQGTRDVAIPVGHETQYMANLKAKLEMSPNSPEGAGDYIVRQTNGENEYVTLASNATIQDIIARLEALEGGE